jgi:hypothetical protein
MARARTVGMRRQGFVIMMLAVQPPYLGINRI